MTLNKYSTSKQGRSHGPESSSQFEQPNSHASDSGKSNQAARMAQALGSQRSWADVYAPHTPAGSVATPAASTVDGDEREHLLRRQDPDDPPPAYDGPPRIPELSGEPVINNRSTPSNVRPFHNHDEESESSSQENHEHEHSHSQSQSPDELEAAQHSTVRCGRRRRRNRCPKEKVQRRRRVKVGFLLVAFVLVCMFMAVPQHIPALREIILPTKPLPSRTYTRHETSQSITGTFTFFDLLDLSTTSGSIRIVIDPQPGDKPAVLRLSSSSGSIKVDVADSYLNRLREKGSAIRPWDTSIKSASGSLRIKLPIGGGSNTVLQVQSASIVATFIASDIGPHDNVSTLITESASGSQAIVVQPLIGTTAISNLVAKHYSSGSASMKVAYPQVWQGVVHASVGGSASVKVQGDDLKYQYNGDKDVYAWRGEGQALDVRCDGSGSIKVDCSSLS